MTRNRYRAIALLTVTITAGIASRMLALHGPLWLRKDPGDVLWGAAVYWLLATLFIRFRPFTIFAVAISYSLATEVFKLYDPPLIHHVRYTTIGHLVLGQVFSWRDIACYLVGIAVSTAVDSRWAGKQSR